MICLVVQPCVMIVVQFPWLFAAVAFGPKGVFADDRRVRPHANRD